MNKLFASVLLCALCFSAVSIPALAADRGPQKQATVVTTNANPATVNLPIGDTGRFDPAWLFVTGNLNGTTQTVTWVVQGATGTLATVTAVGAIGVTNVPTMFSGDKFLITTTGLTTNSVTVTTIGRVFD